MKKPNDHAEPTKVERYKNIKILHLSQTDRQTDRQTDIYVALLCFQYVSVDVHLYEKRRSKTYA